jgi:hypothetical protein
MPEALKPLAPGKRGIGTALAMRGGGGHIGSVTQDSTPTTISGTANKGGFGLKTEMPTDQVGISTHPGSAGGCFGRIRFNGTQPQNLCDWMLRVRGGQVKKKSAARKRGRKRLKKRKFPTQSGFPQDVENSGKSGLERFAFALTPRYVRIY